MDLTTLAVLGVLAVVAVSVAAPRLGIAAPLLLVATGVILSFVPGVPRAEVEPEIILAGVLPPLLYASAVSMPAMDFRRDLKSIGGLSVVVVVASAAAIGWALSSLVPGLGFAEGFALGAIVSPTDAVATSIVKKTGVAPRLVTLLDGESMLNDASALVLLRSAVAAAGASVSVWHVAGDFVRAVLIALLVGVVVGALSLAIRSVVADATICTAISFVVPFIAYTPAEHLHGSGLVAVVVAGLVTGYRGVVELRPEDRLAEETNWRTIAFLLEGGVFLLMGLELRPLVDDFRADGGEWGRLVLVTAIAFGILLAVRGIYVALLVLDMRQDRGESSKMRPRIASFREYLESAEAQKLSERRRERARQAIDRREADLDFFERQPLGRRDGAVLVWAGMRGTVTLAAAQTLPEGTEQRELLILAAFCIAGVSLLLQGGTLGWIVRRLGAEADRSGVRRE